MRLIFWIGHDFYDCYLNQDTFNSHDELIHSDLLNKILFIYEKANNVSVDEITEEYLAKSEQKNMFFTMEGTDVDFNEYIDGERVNFVIDEKKKKLRQ